MYVDFRLHVSPITVFVRHIMACMCHSRLLAMVLIHIPIDFRHPWLCGNQQHGCDSRRGECRLCRIVGAGRHLFRLGVCGLQVADNPQPSPCHRRLQAYPQHGRLAKPHRLIGCLLYFPNVMPCRAVCLGSLHKLSVAAIIVVVSISGQGCVKSKRSCIFRCTTA